MRTFLGWQYPLRSLADAILARGSGSWFDFHELTVVIPSARAGRRLLEMLAVEAARRGCAFSPPRIVTSGRAPEIFREETGKTPGEFSETLAWIEALARIQPTNVTNVADVADRLETAHAMAGCLSSLSAAGLEPGQAKEKLSDSRVSCDLSFWETFTKAYAAYAEILRKWGYEETHGARRLAIRQDGLACPGPVILAGVIEMPWALREMVRRFDKQVEILVFAPPERKDDFDELGCLISRKWNAAPALKEEIVEFVDGPSEQADSVVRELLRYPCRYAADEVTVGVPDEEVAPLVELRLTRAGIPARMPIGRSLGNGPVCKLLALAADFLRERTFANVAALARHPDLAQRLSRLGVEGDLPGFLDKYQSEHFLRELPETWPGEEAEAACLGSLARNLDQEFQPLREPAADTLAGWAKKLSSFLSRVYEERSLNPNDPHQAVLFEESTAVGAALRELAENPSTGANFTAQDAIAVLLKVLGGQSIPAPGEEPALELLGWLELAMDDAPALIVTGMNEGVIPASPGVSPVLPEPVWQELGLPGDGDRFARDNYVLHVLLNSRKHLRLIAARRTGDGHPLLPSRLLLQENADNAAKRLLAFFPGNKQLSEEAATPGPQAACPAKPCEVGSPPASGQSESSLSQIGRDGRVPLPGSLKPGRELCALDEPPKPDPDTPLPKSMSVTSFRAYIECPYRYYLRHVLGLRAVTDASQEMDPLNFGSLMHVVLQSFPKTLKNGRGSRQAIRECLLSSLSDALRRQFGSLSPRLRLQAEVLRLRIEAFADWQAGWAAQGYSILHSELEFRATDRKRRLDVDGRPMFIHGRIDRIDVKDDLSEAVVFDYKTSTHAQKPEKAHFDGERWTDLQLPLYRHLIEELPGLPQARRLGYIALPSDATGTAALIAEWTDQQLADADEAARNVVRGIRKRIFWPPARLPDSWTDDFADICRSTRFVARPGSEEDSDEADA